MKTSVKILTLVLVIVMIGALLTSCGNILSGKYVSEEIFGSRTEWEFGFSSVTLDIYVAGYEISSIEGTYKIEDDKITIEFSDEDADDEDTGKYSGTFDFEKGEDYIKIGSFGKLTKKD